MGDVKNTVRDIMRTATDKPARGAEIAVSAGRDVKNVTIISRAGNVSITPGAQHITEEQAARLKKLVHDVARLERLHAANPVTVPTIWGKLKETLCVASYRFIPKETYAEAVEFLLDWQSRAMRDGTRDAASLEERAKVYRICHAIAKQYNLGAEMRALMASKWDADSMRDLEDDELRELLAFMRALETQYKR